MKTPFTFTASIRAERGKPRKLAILGYGGGLMTVSGLGRIVVDISGMEFPASVTVLRDHENAIAGVVGSAIPKIVNGQLLFDATCANTESANDVLAILESGVALQASIGAMPIDAEFIKQGETVQVNGRSVKADEHGFTLIHTSKLREITIVPCGADDSTSVSIAAKLAKGKNMPITLTNFHAMLKAAGTRFTDDEIDAMSEDEAKAALKKCMNDDEPDGDETEKPAEASALLDMLSDDHLPKGIQATALKEKWSMTTARNVSLAYLRASRPGPGVGVPNYGSGHHGGFGADNSAPFVAAMLSKMGFERQAEKRLGAQALEMSRPLHRASTIQILGAYLQSRGIQADPHDPEGMIRADASSINTPSLLANVLGKTLEMQWVAQPATWRSWCNQRSAKDFKPQSAVRPSFMGSLSQLAPSGEIENANIQDWAVAWQVFTFSKMLTVPRQLIINDDLGGFAEIPAGFAQMSERAMSDLVYATLMSNPSSFFSVGNNNLQTGGTSPLSATSLATAMQKLRKQTAPNGSPLNLQPAVLIVTPALEQTARALLNSQFLFRDQASDQQPAGNPLQGSCALEVESRLELGCTSPINGSSAQTGAATKWYLTAGPATLPGIVGFLNTGNGPTIQTAGPDYNFNQPGMSIRCILDCGFSTGDYRAMQYSAGA